MATNQDHASDSSSCQSSESEGEKELETLFRLTEESGEFSLAGEKRDLLRTYSEDSFYFSTDIKIQLDENAIADLQTGTSFYGHPFSRERAMEEFPPGDSAGLVWHATLIPDDFFRNGKLMKGLNKSDFDADTQTIKPRRPTLPVTASDFLSSLTKIDGPRWIFHGILNGWPGMTSLELISIERRRGGGSLVWDKLLWKDHWSAEKEGQEGIEPTLEGADAIYRVTLRGAPWTSLGWSKESRGFVFWYERQLPTGPRFTYGTNIAKTVSDDNCSFVHMVSHRYAVKKESPKDKLTYHSIVLLEWEHGEYCTVVEGAYLNGMSGYKGKSNWYVDVAEPTQLFQHLPPEMIAPWLTTAFEIRCYDIACRSFEEFQAFIAQHEGFEGRFVDPQYTFSHRARLTYRSKSHIAQYLANYIGRDQNYHELKRNCQTMAADLCSFLAGKKGIVPFHPVNRIAHHNQTHMFLYDSHLYEGRKPKNRKSTKG